MGRSRFPIVSLCGSADVSGTATTVQQPSDHRIESALLLAGYWTELDRVTMRRPELVFYTSHPQGVTLPPQAGQPPIQSIGTFTLFLWNQGRAPAREGHVGHNFIPAHNTYSDIPREIGPSGQLHLACTEGGSESDGTRRTTNTNRPRTGPRPCARRRAILAWGRDPPGMQHRVRARHSVRLPDADAVAVVRVHRWRARPLSGQILDTRCHACHYHIDIYDLGI